MWGRPSHVALVVTLVLHAALGVVLWLIKVTVQPLAGLPMEVELWAGDLGPRPGANPPPAAGPASPPQAVKRPAQVAPLRPEAREDLAPAQAPAPSALDLAPLPWRQQTSSPPGPSPASRLSPIPVASEGRESAVRVRVEGVLSSRRILFHVDPVFPPDAPRGGVVRVRLVVGPDGVVKLATVVLKASPPLERAALDALSQWRFAPAPGQPDVEGVVTVEFVVQ